MRLHAKIGKTCPQGRSRHPFKWCIPRVWMPNLTVRPATYLNTYTQRFQNLHLQMRVRTSPRTRPRQGPLLPPESGCPPAPNSSHPCSTTTTTLDPRPPTPPPTHTHTKGGIKPARMSSHSPGNREGAPGWWMCLSSWQRLAVALLGVIVRKKPPLNLSLRGS